MDFQEGLETGFFSTIILIAVSHGIFLACIFLFHPRFNSKSNQFLALSILGISVILAYEFIYWLEIEDSIPLWIQYLPLYIRTTIPVGIFYFVIFLIQPDHQLSNFERMGFVFIALEILLDSTYFPINLMIESEATIALLELWIILIGWFLSIVAGIIFIPTALLRVNRYQQLLLNNYSTTGGKSLAWLRIFLLVFLFVLTASAISFIQYLLEDLESSEFSFSLVTIGLVMLLFWIGYAMILKYRWFEIVPFKEIEITKETNGNKLSSKTNAYHQNLLALMENKKLYEDPDLTLDRLSEHLHISSGYLSQVINEKEKKNFFEFINAYRVEAVKEKLLDQQFQKYTIMGIAMESGFNSKSTFNAVFKKFTGLTPSAFKKINT